MSSSPKAKFAPRSPGPPSALTKAERHAFAFAKEVRGLSRFRLADQRIGFLRFAACADSRGV